MTALGHLWRLPPARPCGAQESGNLLDEAHRLEARRLDLPAKQKQTIWRETGLDRDEQPACDRARVQLGPRADKRLQIKKVKLIAELSSDSGYGRADGSV